MGFPPSALRAEAGLRMGELGNSKDMLEEPRLLEICQCKGLCKHPLSMSVCENRKMLFRVRKPKFVLLLRRNIPKSLPLCECGSSEGVFKMILIINNDSIAAGLLCSEQDARSLKRP